MSSPVQAELDHYFRAFGCHHTACGRNLHGRKTGAQHTAAAPWLEEKVRQPTVTREPIRHIIEGARAYNSARGLGDPHDVDFHGIRQTADRIHHLAREYDRLPNFDQAAVPHFEAMRRQVRDQFDHLTNRMGVRAEFVDHDPYANSHEMAEDLRNNRRIQVLKTEQTGGHPFFTDHENDMFRAVHDAFGHAGTGRDFDKHGEEAAWHAHARMFTPEAHGALASETRGQNGHLIYHGSFGPQKIALMHSSLWTPEGLHFPTRTAAADWDEFRRVQDTQRRRYERAGVGGSAEDRDRYFGTGEMMGRGSEQLVTPQQWIQHSRTQTLDDVDPHFQENWRGHEIGFRHAQTGSIDHGELAREHARSPHPDDFIDGYHEGLASGFGEDMGEHRIASLLDDNGKPTGFFAKVAHVSGNQIDVLHCPFCGSGAIVARSDGSIQCTFCNAAYTVTVSPVYPAFPMSVGGQPYPWPGRPDGGVDPSMMQMGDQPGGGFGGQLIPGGGGDADAGDDSDDDDNPFASDSGDEGDDSSDEGSSSSDGDDSDKEAEVGGKKKPPFGKKSSSRFYTTAVGGRVARDDLLRHLAIHTAKDPNEVAARIRQERTHA